VAVKPCHQNRAVVLDPVLLPDRKEHAGLVSAIYNHRLVHSKGIQTAVFEEICELYNGHASQG
jgi:hypothetical protein